MSSKEIITIQAGNFANFIGTHWWNLQESSFCYTPNSSVPIDINHDVLFREGLNFRGEQTYTPRLVVIDVPENVRSIRGECPLYRTPQEDRSNTPWEGAVEVMQKDPIRRNPFLEEYENVSENSADGVHTQDANNRPDPPDLTYDFNSQDTVWSDFLKTNLHPRSLCLLNDLMSAEDSHPMDLYSTGEEMYSRSGKETIEDALRGWVEECDYLQGFHLLFDGCNAFAGISSQILQYFDDEYKRLPSLCFPVYQENESIPIENAEVQMHRLYAALYSVNSMNSYSTLFSPLSLTDDIVKLSTPFRRFPYLQYDEKLLYHTSAILAASIETLTSPYRLKSMKFNLWDITSAMSTYGRKLVSSSASLPFPLSENTHLNSLVEKENQDYYMTSLTPFFNPQNDKSLFQSSVLRGVPTDKYHNLGKSAYYAIQPEEVFEEFLNKYSPSSVTTATVLAEMCSVATPFPTIFKDCIGDNGFLNSSTHSHSKGVSKVPVSASFCNTDSSAEFLEKLLTQADKSSFKEFIKGTESTYERDGHLEIIENILSLQDNYKNYQ